MDTGPSLGRTVDCKRVEWLAEWRVVSLVHLSDMGAAMSSEPTVRFVVPADFSQWLSLWDGYNSFYGRSGKTALPDEITKMTWMRFFDAYEPVMAMVAEDDGQLVGLVHYIFHRSTISIAPTCYLQDLFTKESARGKGIGRRLIDAVYEQARQAGSSRVYWHTHESNRTAMKLYDKMAERSGFVVYRKNFE
jgi:GNAT superfamily N-acetyltransferase